MPPDFHLWEWSLPFWELAMGREINGTETRGSVSIRLGSPLMTGTKHPSSEDKPLTIAQSN